MVTEKEAFVFPDVTRLDFGSWCWMKSKVYKQNVDTLDKLLALMLDLLPTYRSMKINLDEQYTIFAHNLRSALRLMVDCLNIYCELQYICYLCVTNLLFQH